jgi:multidrug efflux pump subunit AcrB
MNLSTWSVKNNRTAAVLFFLIAVVGIQTYFTIPRLENPEFTVRLALVQTVFPGASPERVEQLVTSKIEKKIREMGELKNIISESRTGVSIITAEFEEQYDDMEPIFKRLRNKVDDAKRELPKEAGLPIVNDEFGDVFGIVIALTGDGYSYREMEDYAEDIRDELLSLDMVAKVEIHGTQEERIFIEFSNALLAE